MRDSTRLGSGESPHPGGTGPRYIKIDPLPSWKRVDLENFLIHWTGAQRGRVLAYWQKVIFTAADVLEVAPGLRSRYQNWKFQTSPLAKTVP